jgi:hypothetical protein
VSSAVQNGAAVEVFYSYSHQDEALRDELEKQLSILKRRNIIRTWHDRKIGAGMEWADQISKHLNSADLILLLISADFLASDYCYDIELTRAMQRHDAGEAKVVPIILRDVDWRDAPFGKLQALPTNARPVTSWSNRDEAFADIARGIRATIEQAAANPSLNFPAPSELPINDVSVPRLLPYLCDRSEQERELRAALRKHLAERARRPFVCFLHGDEFECHREFLERMQHTVFSQTLNLEARQISLEEHQVNWPSARLTNDQYLRIFTNNLGSALLQNNDTLTDEIIRYIAGTEKPLLLVSNLLTEGFVETDTELVSAYLKFWNDWPDLPPGRILINCVCLKYQRLEQMGLFQRWRLKRLDSRLRTYLKRLDFSGYQNLAGVVLTELQAIRRTDVEDWTRIQAVRSFCEIQERDIRALFQRPEYSGVGVISMEALADELRELAHRSRTPKR